MLISISKLQTELKINNQQCRASPRRRPGEKECRLLFLDTPVADEES